VVSVVRGCNVTNLGKEKPTLKSRATVTATNVSSEGGPLPRLINRLYQKTWRWDENTQDKTSGKRRRKEEGQRKGAGWKVMEAPG